MLRIVRQYPVPAVLLLAFALRAGAAVGVQHLLDHRWQRTFVIAGDAEGYWELGRRIAAGEEYAVYEPPRRVLRMPGFPVLLAGAIRLADGLGLEGQRFLVARLLLAGIGTLACGLVYLLGRTLYDKRAGLIAALVTAVSPPMAGFSVLILSETLFAAALTGSLLGMAALVRTGFDVGDRRRGLWTALLAGVLVALAVYARPSWLLAGPLFVACYVALAADRWQATLRGCLVLLGLSAALMPWAARNYAVSGHWVWTTLWVGPSLYDGLNPRATGDSDMTFFDQDRLRERGLTEYEVDRHYRREAWQFVRENPGRTLQLAGVKAGRYFSPVPNAQQFAAWWMQAAVAVVFVPMIVCTLRGAWIAMKGQGTRVMGQGPEGETVATDHGPRTTDHGQPPRSPLWLLLFTLGPLLYFAAIHLVFVGSLRYRLPAEYPLAVLAAVGLLSWFPTRSRAE